MKLSTQTVLSLAQGQMPEEELQRLLRDNPAFAEWLRARSRDRQAK